MNRILFEQSEIAPDGTVRLTDARAEHIRTVLHGAPGQPLKTGVIDGLIGVSTIVAVDSAAVVVRASNTETAPAPWIDLILAVPRPRVLKRLLPQLAALGAGRIFLVGAEKVEKSYWGAQCLNSALYRPLLVEGLMQAGTTALPTITIAKNFRTFMTGGGFAAAFAGQPRRFVAHPGAASDLELAGGGFAARPVLSVGPEGGWTDDEIALLESDGFARFSLGPRILRTDTATIALLAVLADRLGQENQLGDVSAARAPGR